MTDEVVTCEIRDHVAIVTLNRPAVANAVNPELAQSLGKMAHSLEADDSVRAVILTGAGQKAFCAGADLKSIADGERTSLYTEDGGFAGIVDLPRRKFWIAAVEAPALAGGLEIALSCDLIVATSQAKFALPEVKRGMIAAAGGLFRLPRKIAMGHAMAMIATGDAISAERGFAIGLVDELTAPGEALTVALRIAGEVARNAPIAVRESLTVARLAQEFGIGELRQLSHEAAQRNAQTEDFLEGPKAFLEKREPQWQGR